MRYDEIASSYANGVGSLTASRFSPNFLRGKSQLCQQGVEMEIRDFFAKRSLFSYDEFTHFLDSKGSTNVKTRDNLLDHHIKAGNIHRVAKGLYASVPPGSDPRSVAVDAFLLTSKMAPDATLGYHTALELAGRAHSVHERFTYLTRHHDKARSRNLRGYEFQGVLFPKALRDKGKDLFGVIMADRAGTSIRVTSLERTLVDVMDRPTLGGGWEEIWRSLESVEFFDLDEVVEYALLLENRTTAAKVGFYLESRREELMVEDDYLKRLLRLRPRQRTYMVRTVPERKRTNHRAVKKWNLLVPETILQRSWEEAF